MRIVLVVSAFLLLSTDLAAADVIRVPADQPTLRAAIDAARNGDTVLVADGVYDGPENRDLSFGGKSITVRSENGFEKCVITCDFAGRAFHFNGGETTEAVLRGFTIINGLASEGGAILCSAGSSPTIADCSFFANRAVSFGGGIACRGGSSPDILRCTFIFNMVRQSNLAYGGGVACFGGSNPRILSCAFFANDARVGGAIGCDASSPQIGGCIMSANSADFGAGVGCFDASPTLSGCTLATNQAITGGGIYGGGFLSGSNIRVSNSILWNDSPTEIQIDLGQAQVIWSDVDGGWPGAGNIDDDPLFADKGNGDLHLMGGSPCINAGDPSFAATGATDVDAEKRVWGGRVDMGADEFGSFRFGDLNCDGAIDAFDIEGFIAALIDPNGYATQHPNCDVELADVNGDGAVDAFDIDAFVQLF